MAEEHVHSDYSLEENLDFTKSIPVKSMLEIYKHVEGSRCECGGKLFPGGPVGLKPPEDADRNLKFELMIVYCSNCEKEERVIFAVDTSSKEYHDEQKRAYSELDRWERHTQGNPIKIEDEE